MPEGDSYTHAAARIQPVLVGRRITGVEGSSPAVRRRSAAILGQRVTGVRTHGKHLLVDLATELSIHVHLGMSGRVRVTTPDRGMGRNQGAVRLALTTERGKVWVLGAPTVEVERRQVIEQTLRRLGPDVLAPEFDLEAFRSRAAHYPSDRTVSDLLLDQRVLAGIGNEYKCEVLFLERVRPDRPVSTVDAALLDRLALRARRLMTPNQQRFGRSTTGGPDGALWVYARTGRPCRRCRTSVREDWIGRPPRITYWCPACQT